MGIDTKGFEPNPDITKEELEAMRIDVADRIIVARVGLLLDNPPLVIWLQGLLLNTVMIGAHCSTHQQMVDTYITIHNFLMHFPTKK